MHKQIKLKKLIRIPNFRALLWDENYLYISRGYMLYKLDVDKIRNKNINVEKIASFRPDVLRNIASKNRILSRLLRIGFHAIRKLKNKIIGIVPKNIVLLEPGEKEFRSVFKIKRGTRPLGMAVTPDGKIYFGEYFNNPERKEVYIYGSEDGGYTWEVVHVFPQKTIRHVHNILYDEFEDCLWVLTGDEGKEPMIIKTDTQFNKMDVVLEGNQQARVVTMVFKKDKVLYATDTPHEQNYIYSLDRKTGKIEKLAPVSGPSLWSCEVGDFVFFSTDSEPGKAFYPYACLYGSRDEMSWEMIFKWKKDFFHPILFQYGDVVLPFGKNKSEYLAVTGKAVEKEDGCLNIWRIE